MKISTVAKIPITANLGKYLGIPSITGRFHAGLFQDIMDRIDGKLNGWKTKLLSLAGRTVMAQAVLTTIPMYPMQGQKNRRNRPIFLRKIGFRWAWKRFCSGKID